jgi:hypothetical protein
MEHKHIWKSSLIEGINCGREPEDCPERVNVTTMIDQFPRYIHGCERPITYKRCACGSLLM